jgi:MotA/TolQ/ExbB proton channel family protein
MTERQPHWVNRGPLLHWLIFTGFSLFGFVLLWHYGLIRQMVVADRTHISSLIVLLYGGTTLHCLWRNIVLSREGEAARRTALLIIDGGPRLLAAEGAGLGLVAAHIGDVLAKAARQGGRPLDQTLLLRGLAARLRGSNGFGAFAGDTLMKLGLVGTIIGFIMMLAPIAGLDTGDRGSIKSSMTLMSDGMAVAMYTTLAGLAASILVSLQYYLLEDATAKLFAFAVGLVETHVVALPEGFAEPAA